ncbi:MAG TPA: response regulator transcription factor [Roseiflexaceae bacterium]|nr:response regulator transcription factor [Roseiflexaceae bacterium]
MPTILVVDDDRKLVDMLRRTLSYEGFQVMTATDGLDAIDKAGRDSPDAVVLDWMLPGMDGIEVVRALRATSAVPILMLTARDAIEDRVEGLDRGADDYLVKPFAPSELLARVRALLRRGPPPARSTPLCYAALTLDPLARQVRRGDRPIGLSPKEFALLELFMRHPLQVLLRDQILDAVWGYEFAGNGNLLEVYIGYLRAKTEAGGEPRLIQTVRGVGYVLREEPAAEG